MDQGRGQHLTLLRREPHGIPKLERAMERFLRGSNASHSFMPQPLSTTNLKPRTTTTAMGGGAGKVEDSEGENNDAGEGEKVEFGEGTPVERVPLPVRHTVTLGADRQVLLIPLYLSSSVCGSFPSLLEPYPLLFFLSDA